METIESKVGLKCDERYIIFDEARGEFICTLTGEVIEQEVDLSREWREFGEEDRRARSRVGGALTNRAHDKGLATTISSSDIRKLKPSQRRRAYAIRRRLASTRIANKNRLVKALQILDEEGKKLQLPKRTLETASILIRKAVEKGYGRGENIRSYVAAALFLACKATRVPRSFNEIIASVGVDYEKTIHAQRNLIELKTLELPNRVQKPSEFIPMIADKLNLKLPTQNLMYRLCKAVEKLNLAQGKSPVAVAAAIAYIAAAIMGEKRNQREIADTIKGFTDVAIRNRYREIVDNLYIEVQL